MGKRSEETLYQKNKMAKDMKRHSASYVIRALEIKMMMKCHYIPSKMAKIPNTTPNADKNVEQ